MAFEGNLRDLEFGDVVQTLSMTRQHGTLVIHASEERRVAFTDRGLAFLSARRSHGDRVGRYLLGIGRVTREAFDAAMRSTRRDAGAGVGDALLSAHAVDEADLTAARRYIVQNELFELFSLREGRFEFLNDELELTGPFAGLWFDVGGIAMEAARRIDETPRLDAVVPSGQVLTPADPAAAPPEGDTPDGLRHLYDLADGTRTVADLVANHHLGEFDTRKCLASLVEGGALRPATAVEILQTVERVSDAARAAQLLGRAVELDATQPHAWERLAKALAASGDKPGAARALCEVAKLQYADGHGEDALTTLRSALKLRRQSPEAHALLTRTLLALEQIPTAVEAAHDAVTECLAAEAPHVALEIALATLAHVPDDIRLQRGAAAAHAALGQSVEAVAILDRVAHDLFKDRGREKELIEIYRSILSLAPDRADVQENLVAVAERAARRRRRNRQLVIGGAALLLVAAIALPSLLGTNVQERLDRMNELVAAERYDEAQRLLNELDEENIEEELLRDARQALQRRVDAAQRPQMDSALPKLVIARTDAIYADVRERLAARAMSEGLALLLTAQPEVRSQDVERIAASSPETAKKIREDFDSEIKTALIETESTCVELGAWANGILDRLQSSAALKRAEFTTEPEDLEELQTLAQYAAEVEQTNASNDWAALAATVPKLVEAAQQKPGDLQPKILAAVQTLTTALDQAGRLGERATAHVHRLQLLTQFRDAKHRGMELVGEGRLEEAAELFGKYLAFCDEVKAAERGEVYTRIVRGYMETFQLESMLREQLDHIEKIIAREKTADAALLGDDVNTAFALRVGLVREFPQVGFASRFELPLRIESRPPGADIVLQDADGERHLGRTTSVVQYPAVGDSTVVVRMEGFEDIVLQRHGAFDDADGEEVVELMKRPLWRSGPGAATEAGPVVWKDRVIVADRDGVIRALSIEDGSELARVETGLLGGFSGTPTLRGDRLYLAGVDGVGFVLDPASLETLHRFDLPGAVRTALLATTRGVVIVDERGTVHLVDERGKDIWKREVGVVLVDPEATQEHVVLVTLSGRLVVLSLADGTEKVGTQIPGQPRWTAPVIADGRAWVASESGTLAAVNLSSGAVSWQTDAGDRLVGRPAVVGSVVAVPASGGRVLLRPTTDDAPAASAHVAEVGPVGDGVAALADGFVTAGRTGVVRRIAPDGALAWRFDAGDAVGARPVRADGRVLIVTRAGQVIALAD